MVTPDPQEIPYSRRDRCAGSKLVKAENRIPGTDLKRWCFWGWQNEPQIGEYPFIPRAKRRARQGWWVDPPKERDQQDPWKEHAEHNQE